VEAACPLISTPARAKSGRTQYKIDGLDSSGSAHSVTVDAEDEIDALTLARDQGILRATTVTARPSFMTRESFGWVDISDYYNAEILDTIGASHDTSMNALTLSRHSEKLFDKELNDIWQEDMEQTEGDGELVSLEYRRKQTPSMWYRGEECVSTCSLTRQRVLIELSRPLGEGVCVDHFDVELNIDDKSYIELRDALRWLFRDKPGVLLLS
jgi:hypothetical protein